MAKSAHEALLRERFVKPDEVFLDEKQQPQEERSPAIGFNIPTDYD